MCESGARSRWRHSSCPSSSCPHLALCSCVSAQGYFWLALVWMFFSHVILREASCVFLVQWHFWGAREDFVRKDTSSVSNHSKFSEVQENLSYLPHWHEMSQIGMTDVDQGFLYPCHGVVEGWKSPCPSHLAWTLWVLQQMAPPPLLFPSPLPREEMWHLCLLALRVDGFAKL